MGLEDFTTAIRELTEGNKIYNSSTDLLNALGISYYRTGNISKALEVLNVSLRLNPDQDAIKRLIKSLEKSGNLSR
jgi:tetratricopeptide (TPR) repeat protein